MDSDSIDHMLTGLGKSTNLFTDGYLSVESGRSFSVSAYSDISESSNEDLPSSESDRDDDLKKLYQDSSSEEIDTFLMGTY